MVISDLPADPVLFLFHHRSRSARCVQIICSAMFWRIKPAKGRMVWLWMYQRSTRCSTIRGCLFRLKASEKW
uniref:Uncharacterized protein n=1 Tax=Kalanchoe fedtschenkoi TaxID=63787 RepID=A0A7N0VIF3_KALFE